MRRDLWNGNVGDVAAAFADKDVDILLERKMRRIVNTHAGSFVHVGGIVQHARDHLRMFAFLSRLRTVFAIARDVKDRAQFRLQRQRLADEFFVSGEVFAGCKGRERFLALEQNLIWMLH